ncbi:MAG TPA: MarR family transcriptional regulator [Ilumatobacter sp.]|nr:MarR family transcriptional regulator [Ilumatobacter sp.]
MSGEPVDLLGDPADLERLRVVLIRLTRRIRASAHDTITASQRSTLGTIYMHGPTTIGQIAEYEHVQPPSASKVVAALEQMGLVERSADPNDRRCSLISLTAHGHDSVNEMRVAGLGFLAGRLAELDPHDLATLEGSLPALERLLGSTDDEPVVPAATADDHAAAQRR